MFAAMAYKLNDLIHILVEGGGADAAYLTHKVKKGELVDNKKGYLMRDIKKIIEVSLNQKYERSRMHNWARSLGLPGISNDTILSLDNALALIGKAVEFHLRVILTIPPQMPDLEDHGIKKTDRIEIAKRIFAVAVVDADYWEVCVTMNLPKGKKIKKDENKSLGYFKRMAKKAA